MSTKEKSLRVLCEIGGCKKIMEYRVPASLPVYTLLKEDCSGCVHQEGIAKRTILCNEAAHMDILETFVEEELGLRKIDEHIYEVGNPNKNKEYSPKILKEQKRRYDKVPKIKVGEDDKRLVPHIMPIMAYSGR